MFTGLIETLGTIISADRKGTSVIIGIEPDCSPFDVNDGDSVAIDGICLTAERKKGSVLIFSAVRETLSRTSLSATTTPILGKRVNLERALRLSDRLDGHLVLGHVDDIGKIVSDEDVQGSILRTFAVPAGLRPYMAQKGSVAIDGVSLTIAKSTEDTMTVSIIPATLQRTNILMKKTGDFVNLECDVVARYLYRFTKFNTANGNLESDSLINKLERFGF